MYDGGLDIEVIIQNLLPKIFECPSFVLNICLKRFSNSKYSIMKITQVLISWFTYFFFEGII